MWLAYHHVRDARGVRTSSHVVSANDVCAIHDKCCFCGDGAIDALGHRRIFSIPRQCSSDKRFARHTRQQWIPQFMQLVEALEQRIIFLKALAKSKSWIEHDALPLQARDLRGI